MYIFAAAPHTFIVDRTFDRKHTAKLPVVAWSWVQGYTAFPLAAMNYGGLTRGRAVLTPDGMVTDSSANLAFNSLEAWEKHLDTNEEYWSAPDKSDAARLIKDGAAAAVETEKLIDEIKEQIGAKIPLPQDPEINRAIPDKPRRVRAPRVFKTNSYWQNGSRIRTIPGGNPVPHEDDPNWTKITGEEFRDLKKDGAIVIEEDGGDPDGAPAADAGMSLI